MSNHEASEQLNDYVDGVLSAEQRHRVESHLAGCILCREEVNLLRTLRDEAAALPESIAPPRDLWPEIAGRIEAGQNNVLPLAPSLRVSAQAAARGFTRGKRLALAACVLVAIGGGLWVSMQRATPAWKVARLEGVPVRGTERVNDIAELAVGDWLETDGTSRARLEVGTIGELEMEPNTRLRLLESKPTDHRIALAKGTIHATIWSPPRLFFVETPSATAIDLGCAYTLHVDEEGAGILTVSSGWVALELAGRSSTVPAGAQCKTRPGVGPGTPYVADATPRFRQAVEEFDFADPSAETIRTLVTEARPRDAVTLFHLLSRVEEGNRTMIYDRLASFMPPPKGVTCDGIVKGDSKMMKAWSEDLGLGAHWWEM